MARSREWLEQCDSDGAAPVLVAVLASPDDDVAGREIISVV
jgi:hypothetical protein